MLVTCQMRVGQKEACSPLLLQKVMGLRHALGVKCARFGVELLAAPRALFASQSECRRLKGPCPLYLQSRGPLPATEAVAPTSKEQQHRRLAKLPLTSAPVAVLPNTFEGRSAGHCRHHLARKLGWDVS